MKKKEKSVLLSIENNLFYISNILYLKFLEVYTCLKNCNSSSRN